MSSPFPGMDPYLEASSIWPEAHQRLITYIGDALQPLLRPKYRARINERVVLGEEEPPPVLYPDVSVSLVMAPDSVAAATAAPSSEGRAATLAADEPVRVVTSKEERIEPFLEVRLARGGTLVTVIEVLSPTNKTTAAQAYQQRQRQLLAQGVNLVEIDLLREGLHVLCVPREDIAHLRAHYKVCVARAHRPGKYEVYPMSLRERLKRVAVPLLPPDEDVVLDLPGIFQRCYDSADFASEIDYNTPPEVPFFPDDAAWADALLREKGVRRGQ